MHKTRRKRGKKGPLLLLTIFFLNLLSPSVAGSKPPEFWDEHPNREKFQRWEKSGGKENEVLWLFWGVKRLKIPSGKEAAEI